VQDHLRILGIVLVPAIVQRLAGAGQGDGRDQPQLETRRKQSMCQGTVVVTGGFESDDDRTPDIAEVRGEAIVVEGIAWMVR